MFSINAHILDYHSYGTFKSKFQRISDKVNQDLFQSFFISPEFIWCISQECEYQIDLSNREIYLEYPFNLMKKLRDVHGFKDQSYLITNVHFCIVKNIVGEA